MQIKFTRKTYVLIFASAIIVFAIILLLTIAKKPPVNQASQCETASKIARDAALAWGNTDDMRSDAYQTKLKSFLTEDMKRAFEEEWETLDPLVKINTKVELQGVTCEATADQVTVKIDAKKSENDEPDKPVELTIELIDINKAYLINGFADNYQNNVKKIY